MGTPEVPMQRVEPWALAVVLLMSCGDDEKDKSPAQQCHDLVNTFCDRVRHCAVQEDIPFEPDYTPAELEADCKDAVLEELPCDDADEVDDSYSECHSDLKTFSCEESNDALLGDPPVFASPPESCKESILFVKDE
jgi:hypothetical protein